VVNRVEINENPRATIVIYTQEYPIPLAMVGIGLMSRLNVCCLSILVYGNTGLLLRLGYHLYFNIRKLAIRKSTKSLLVTGNLQQPCLRKRSCESLVVLI